jgi:2-oxoglutarate dehydrogenase E2 component (dihydrolipoamide succinyltransferase)
MLISVTMPQLGESVTEGTVTRWLKREGDRVEADEPLLEVATDKVDTEIPAPASGVLSRIVVAENETIPVGDELAVITAEERAPNDQPETPPSPRPEADLTAAIPEQATGDHAGGSPGPAPGTATVTMPALGESVTEGTVTRWLKAVGEQVTEDEPLLEVATDKVDTEIPAPASGVLLDITVAVDETVPVGATLAVIGTSGGGPATETAPAATPPAPQARPAPPTQPSQPTQPSKSAQPAAAEPPAGYITPLVRKLAAEQGVDLATVTGTGPGGRIRREDVLEAADRKRKRAAAPAATASEPAAPAAARPAPSALRGRTEKLSRMRAVIARRMVESLQTSAQLTTVVEVDVTRIARLRQRVKDDFARVHGVKLSFLPFFALATVEALRVHPQVNASMDEEAGTVTYHGAEHLGIAVDTEKGLMVPVIHNAGDLSLAGLARRIAELAERTRTNRLAPDDVSGGTFTLTNTGSRGALFDTPIINQPQVGILGTGAVVKRAVVFDAPEIGEVIVPRSMVYLSFSYDHRLVDGADAARFLTTIKNRLESGAFTNELSLG